MFSPAFLKVQAELEKEFPGSFSLLAKTVDNRRIPTGVFVYDRLLGGGLPIRRVSLFTGHKSSFKTTMALKVIRNWQQLCGHCLEQRSACQCGDIERPTMAVFIDVEHRLNEEVPYKLGIDPDRLYIARPPHGEAACEYAEKLANVPDVGLLVFDSLASIVSTRELVGEENNSEKKIKTYLDSKARGMRATLINRLYRALGIYLDNPKVPRLAICINHLLPDQEGYGDITPGGRTQKYLSATVTKFWTVDKQTIKVDKDGEEKIKINNVWVAREDKVRKQKVDFLIEYNVTGPENISGEFTLLLDEVEGSRYADSDDHQAIFLFAQKKKLVTESSKNVWLWNGEKFTSQARLFQAWMANPQEYLKLQRELMS